MTRSKWMVAIFAYGVLVLLGVVVAIADGFTSGASYFAAIILATLLAAALVQVANETEIERLEERIAMLRRFACCGCGHPLARHCDPRSSDGLACLDCGCQAVHQLDEPPVEPYLGSRP